MTNEIKVLVGIPASGKSTWANQNSLCLAAEGQHCCIISRDNVRASLLRDGDKYFDREEQVFSEFVRQITKAMQDGIDVIYVDATHVSPGSRRKLCSRLFPDSRINLTFEVFPIDTTTALERNSHREGFARVPDDAIRSMAKSFSIPSRKEFPKNNFGFNSIKVVLHDMADK